VGFVAVRVALHRGTRSRGYKLSREGADHMSLVSGGGVWFRLRWVLVVVARSSDRLIS
jgi:hypothetical protein